MKPWFNQTSLSGETSAAMLSETAAYRKQAVLCEDQALSEQNTLGICYPSKIEVIALLKRVFRTQDRAARQAQLLGSSAM